jgi:protein-disulfide isomerase
VIFDNPEIEDAEKLVVRPMNAEDHIKGSLNAPVHIILFSDPECPYCKEWHNDVLPRLMSKFGDDIAIAFRHRLVSRYEHSEREANAMECADVVGGNDAFWWYLDVLFRETPSDDRLPPEKLYDFASIAGLPLSEFSSCLDEKPRARRIARDVQEAAVAEIAVSPTAIIMLNDASRSVVVPTSRYGPIEASVSLLLSARNEN